MGGINQDAKGDVKGEVMTEEEDKELEDLLASLEEEDEEG